MGLITRLIKFIRRKVNAIDWPNFLKKHGKVTLLICYFLFLILIFIFSELTIIYGPYWAVLLSLSALMISIVRFIRRDQEKLKSFNMQPGYKISLFEIILYGVGLVINYYLIFNFVISNTIVIWLLTILLAALFIIPIIIVHQRQH
jgi:hypothetical protein